MQSQGCGHPRGFLTTHCKCSDRRFRHRVGLQPESLSRLSHYRHQYFRSMVAEICQECWRYLRGSKFCVNRPAPNNIRHGSVGGWRLLAHRSSWRHRKQTTLDSTSLCYKKRRTLVYMACSSRQRMEIKDYRS
jgi:hypothetical protein